MLSDLYIRGLRLDRQLMAGDEDRYFLTIPAIRNLHELTFHRQVTILVGENGSGKSTLLDESR